MLLGGGHNVAEGADQCSQLDSIMEAPDLMGMGESMIQDRYVEAYCEP